MSKPRKLHQLKGTIKHCFSGQVSKKGQWKGQSFYYLEIMSQSLLNPPKKEALYAFPNLVPPDLWKTLEQQTFSTKTYLFSCEKRTRGWRLRNWEEITNPEPT